MDSDTLKQIRNVYDAAAEEIGLPEGWFVRVETAEWVINEMEGYGTLGSTPLSQIAMPMVVNEEGIAHTVAEHEGPVQQVHAERYLEKGIREHKDESRPD